jgi:hypothetical protein
MNFETFGKPALQIGALRVWVHGRQFPDAEDAWDGNWLNVSAHYAAHGARVAVSGALLDTVSFANFSKQPKDLHESLAGEAVLESFEPELVARIHGAGRSGRMRLRVEMTPNNLMQGHWFEEELDQPYLPVTIDSCLILLERYPVRQAAERGA